MEQGELEGSPYHSPEIELEAQDDSGLSGDDDQHRLFDR